MAPTSATYIMIDYYIIYRIVQKFDGGNFDKFDEW